MFNSIKRVFREVGVKLGLIKKLNSLTDHKKISLSGSFYDEIIKWRELYKGYYEGLHDVTVHTIKDGTKKRCMDTLNMPKVVSNEIASLIFNERASISVSDENYNEYIQGVFKDNKFNGKFQNFLEYMFAEGGGVIKPYVKDGKVNLSYVTADCFVPVSWDNRGIREGVFVSQINNQNKNYTHLEWHTFENGVYVITNELYESKTGVDLGVKVPLSTIYNDLEPKVEIQGIERPLFAYFAPATANNLDTTIPLGVSVYANSFDTLKAIDTMFDSYIREFRLGKRRIIVPVGMIKVTYDANNQPHRYFDDSDEVYEAMPGDLDDNRINDLTTELRVEEHISAINSMLNLLALQIGFSPNSLSFNGSGVKTATEVVSENSKTFRTKQSHENVIEQSLTDLIEIIGIVSELYGIYTPPEDYDVTVAFDDSIAQDRNADIDEQIKLLSAGLQYKVAAIAKLYGVTEEEAESIYERIRQESLNEAPSFQEFRAETLLSGGIE